MPPGSCWRNAAVAERRGASSGAEIAAALSGAVSAAVSAETGAVGDAVGAIAGGAVGGAVGAIAGGAVGGAETGAAGGVAGGGDLVIGLGNPLRGDDGVGWWLAQRAETHRSAPRVLRRSLLTPELSLELVMARRVLFLDAWLAPSRRSHRSAPPAGRCRRRASRPTSRPTSLPVSRSASRPISRSASRPAAAILHRLPPPDPADADAAAQLVFSHGLQPSQLLVITTLLCERTPPAWWLLVPAVAFEHGRGFSRQLRRRLPAAARLLHHWLNCAAG